MQVLVVDDSLAVQRSLGRLLDAVPGIQVVGYAVDVTGALSLIEQVHPDVVLLDVNLLDGEKGMDVLRYVKRQRPQTEVVVLTNFSSRQVRDDYVLAGVSAFFDKSTGFVQARDWLAARLTRGSRSDDAANDDA